MTKVGSVKEVFRCAYTKIVPIESLKPHPKNPNKHSRDQIQRLAKIIDVQGQRAPIVVSTRCGLITKGHGRLEALKSLGWKQAAVDYQDYESEDLEYADMVADNAVSEWAELDFEMINFDVPSLGPDFDIDLLGMRDFKLDFEPGSQEDQGQLDQKKFTFLICPCCGEKFELGQATKVEN